MNANTLNQYDAQFNTTAPFCNLEVVDLITDGLQVALLGQTRQQRLHAVVELLFAIKLDGKEKKCFIQANKTINRWDLISEALNKDQPNGSQASCLLTDSISEESKALFFLFPHLQCWRTYLLVKCLVSCLPWGNFTCLKQALSASVAVTYYALFYKFYKLNALSVTHVCCKRTTT